MKSLSGRDFAHIVERRGGSASHKWQPSYLRQEWKHRSAFNSDPRQQAAEDGLSSTFGEARGDFGR